MNLLEFKGFCEELLKELEQNRHELHANSFLCAKFSMFESHIVKLLPDYAVFFGESYNKAYTNGIIRYQSAFTEKAIKIVEYALQLIEKELTVAEKKTDHRLFESAEDKMKQAVAAFRKGDFDSCLNCANTSLELMLKDKLDIPTTITGIYTSKIIDILVSEGLGPVDYLKEAKKHISLDNKTKHLAYKASQVDCISALKALEELIPRLKNAKIAMTTDVKEKVYRGIEFRTP